MIVQAAFSRVVQIQFCALRVLGRDVRRVFKDGGNDRVRFVVGHIAVCNDDRLDRNGLGIGIDAIIGARRNDAFGVRAIDLLQLRNVLVVKTDEVRALRGAQVDDCNRGRAGNDERCVDLAVAERFRRIAERRDTGD